MIHERLIQDTRNKKTLSMTYYSQIDSQTERINQEVKAFLQHYVNYQ